MIYFILILLIILNIYIFFMLVNKYKENYVLMTKNKEIEQIFKNMIIFSNYDEKNKILLNFVSSNEQIFIAFNNYFRNIFLDKSRN